MFMTIFIICGLFVIDQAYIVKPTSLTEAPYPIWAHYHWIWLANQDETQDSLIQLYKDYQSYSIPVGGIIIDSSWPQKYQNFIWDKQKFPNPKQMIDYFHSQDVKVLCWITSTVNNDSTNFQEAKKLGYFLNDGKLIDWGHGNAAFFDYTHPKGLQWWHNQMDLILDLGIDGWKTDGTDPFVFELLGAKGYKGHITEREYADLYYRDFYYYSKSKRGDDFLIMARPVDSYKNTLFLNYAPKDVMFSGWVGDQRGTWEGLKFALTNIIHSSWNNYLNFGMDIGGYKTDGQTPLGRDKILFIRWFQLGAFLPLMENGGIGEHRPWKFGDDVIDIYRNFVNIHIDLSYFFINAGTECFSKNISVIKPIAHKIIPFTTPSTFDYILHNDLFVSPIIDNSTLQTIKLPKGQTWVYWFNSSYSYEGELKNFSVPYDEYPVFIRSGSIIPLKSKDYITLMITKPLKGKYSKNIYQYKSYGFNVKYEYDLNEIDISISANKNNKYIVFLNGINSENAKSLIQNLEGGFDVLSEKGNNSDEYNNSVFKPNKNQMFVKIVHKNLFGIRIKVKYI